ncbi:MAG: PfkB family carbohydrate kinase [Candidatus Zixiibacteriota bacterium]
MVRSRSNSRTVYDCVGLGVNAVDYLSILHPYPDLDDKVDVVRSSVQGGGPVPTAMVTLSRLGANVCYVGKVGNDPEGEFVRSELEKEGVDVRYLIVDRKIKTSKAFIWVDQDSGKRTVALDRDRKNRLSPNEIRFLNSISTKFLHLDGREVEINVLLAKWAKRQRAETCLDVGSLRDGVEKLFPYVDHLIVSSRFACGFTNTSDPFQACRELLKRKFKTVVVTVGEDGCICGRDDEILKSPGFPVKTVDTTGAGDVFHGAFIYGLLKNWSLKKMAKFANACAAMKCRKLGGRAGIPTLKEANDFMEDFKLTP